MNIVFMKTLSKSILLLSFFLLAGNTQAQRNVADSTIGAVWLGVQYGGNFSAGDLADRFGYLNHIGITAGYKTDRNWVFGVDGNFIFGSDSSLRVGDVFHDLRDSKGNITDVNGDIAIVRSLPRGMHANLTVGKIFPVWGPNPNSGIYVNAGVGWLIHRVRIETQDHVVPLLELDYRKGYDRLTSGLNTSQFVGYSFMANGGAVNFYAGLYAQQGFTYNRRAIFFDQPEVPVSEDQRLDIQYGFRVGWLIPIYKRIPNDFYFN